MKQYWVLPQGAENAVGPFSAQQLATAGSDGRWSEPPLVCEVGQTEWIPLTDVVDNTALVANPVASTGVMARQAVGGSQAEWSTAINVRYVSSHPIVKLLNLVIAFCEFISGTRRAGILSVQQERLLVETDVRVLWRFPSSSQSLRISRDKITGVEVGTTRSLFFFRSNICRIFVSGVSVPMTYEVKCEYQELQANADRWIK